MKPLCIYHGNCADGFTSAWVVNEALGGEVDFHAGVYSEAPPDVTGKDVILVDFSYKRPILNEMQAKANTILILDHHKTAAEDLAGFDTTTNVATWNTWVEMGGSGIRSVFDMNRSGAGITWDFFNPGAVRSQLVDYVEDRDLWRFNLDKSREISAAIFSLTYTFENWNALHYMISSVEGFDSLVIGGEAIERKHHKDVAELVGVCKRRMRIGGYFVWGASLPYTLTSDAGHLMADEAGEPFAACYWDTPSGRVFSLRSTENGADVSGIAKQYGGGGHRNAAGFKVPLRDINQFEVGE